MNNNWSSNKKQVCYVENKEANICIIITLTLFMLLQYLEWTSTSLPRPTVRPTPTFTARPHPRRRRSDQLIRDFASATSAAK